MKVKYLTEDGLLLLKNNSKSLFKEVVNGKKTLDEYFEDNSYIKESPIEVDDITLAMNAPDGKESLTDAENVQRVYGHMKHLTDSQASDERIWVAFTLGYFLNYMKYRWKTDDDKDMLNKYFFNYSSQRSLFRNGIARLWWIGRVTYDENRDDQYELTKFICGDQDFIETICGRNIFNNPMVMKATITAMYDANKKGHTMNRELVREIGKYVNLLGGTYIIDFLDYEVIYKKVENYINEHVGE
ncbi:MAG: DUF6339 family protein [Bacillota bacterium]|nr:DUF6339 family protein [Bacillota bacterium]